MEKEVLVSIPVSEDVADALQDPDTNRTVGALVSQWLLTPDEKTKRLMALIAEIKADARTGGLTDEMIDEELAAYNAERRS